MTDHHEDCPGLPSPLGVTFVLSPLIAAILRKAEAGDKAMMLLFVLIPSFLTVKHTRSRCMICGAEAGITRFGIMVSFLPPSLLLRLNDSPYWFPKRWMFWHD